VLDGAPVRRPPASDERPSRKTSPPAGPITRSGRDRGAHTAGAAGRRGPGSSEDACGAAGKPVAGSAAAERSLAAASHSTTGSPAAEHPLDSPSDSTTGIAAAEHPLDSALQPAARPAPSDHAVHGPADRIAHALDDLAGARHGPAGATAGRPAGGRKHALNRLGDGKGRG
jgi:hypothetical protein